MKREKVPDKNTSTQSLTVEEFFDLFNALDIRYHDKPIDKLHGSLTPIEIWRRMRKLREEKKPIETQENDLLKVAKEFFESLPKTKMADIT